MAQSYTALRDHTEDILQDSSNAVFGTTEIDLKVKDTLRELAVYVPHVVKETFQIESRSGTATATTAGALVDTGESQFASTDVDKVIFNYTDKTWAVVTAYVSTSQLTLSKDIMASGETYYMFNKGCKAANQINIENIDYLWVESLEYPIGTKRNVDSIDGDILTIGIDYTPDDSGDVGNDINVDVYFAKRHKLPQLTDFAGAVNNAGGYSAGDTSMAVNGLQTTGTIEAGQEFTVAGTRGLYTVTADATISGNAATITFFPGLENDVDNTDVVTFKQSSLTPILEGYFSELLAAKCAISKSSQPIQESVNAITVLNSVNTAIAGMTAIILRAIEDVKTGRTETDKGKVLITATAGGVLTKVDAEIAQALADLDTGRVLINTINKGGPGVASTYAQYAGGNVNNAIAYVREAQSYMQQAQADESLSGNYGALAGRELANAAQLLNQAVGYMRKINTQESIAGGWRHYQEWGERLRAEVIRKLQQVVTPKKGVIYHRSNE